jgi:hypothetical protein
MNSIEELRRIPQKEKKGAPTCSTLVPNLSPGTDKGEPLTVLSISKHMLSAPSTDWHRWYLKQ